MGTANLLTLMFICFLPKFTNCSVSKMPITLTTYGTNTNFKTTWGSMANCPSGTYAKSFRAKVLKGPDMKGDISLINGVCLMCGPLTGTGSTKVCSSEGKFGNFVDGPACKYSMIGLDFNYAPYQGPTKDDSGLNRIAPKCDPLSNINEFQSSIGYYVEGSTLNAISLKCLRGQAICGIQNEIGSEGMDDYIGITRIRVNCCDVPSPLPKCIAKDKWELVFAEDNAGTGTEKMTRISVKIGRTNTTKTGLTTTQKSEKSVTDSIGVGAGAKVGGLGVSTEFTASAGFRSSTGLDWTRESSEVFSKTITKTFQYQIPSRRKLGVYQIVGECGNTEVNTNVIQIVEAPIGSDLPGPAKRLMEGFFCHNAHASTGPPGTYASGFQKKQNTTGHSDKYEVRVYGVRLICSSIGQNDFSITRPSSSVGIGGEWTRDNYCDHGTMIGFELVERNGFLFDVIATCISDNRSGGKHFVEGDGFTETRNKGLKFGLKNCQKGFAINGLQTRLDSVSGVTGIRMNCLKVQPPVSKCKPKVFYSLLLECNNLKGTHPLECVYEQTEGVSKENTEGTSKSSEDEVTLGLGVTTEASYGIASAKITTEASWKKLVGTTTSGSSAISTNKETSVEHKLKIPANYITRLYQVVGVCDIFQARSKKVKTTDLKGPINTNSPPPNTICQGPTY